MDRDPNLHGSSQASLGFSGIFSSLLPSDHMAMTLHLICFFLRFMTPKDCHRATNLAGLVCLPSDSRTLSSFEQVQTQTYLNLVSILICLDRTQTQRVVLEYLRILNISDAEDVVELLHDPWDLVRFLAGDRDSSRTSCEFSWREQGTRTSGKKMVKGGC